MPKLYKNEILSWKMFACITAAILKGAVACKIFFLASFFLFFCGCTKIIKHGGHNLLHYFGQGSDGQWIQQLLLLLYVAHPLFKLVTSDLCSSENIWSCVRIRQVNRSILLCKKDFCLHYFLASKTTTAKKSFYSSSCSRWRKLNQHISAKSVFFFLFLFSVPSTFCLLQWFL